MDMIRYFFIALLSLTFAACQNKTSGEQANDSTAKAAALPQEVIDTLQQVVMRTQQQNKLYTTECKIHKVVLFSDTKKNRRENCSTSTNPATAKWPFRST